MQRKLLSKKILGSILAVGALTASSTALANSGGEFNLRGDYVGLYPDGSNVIVDMRIDGIAYGSYGDNGILSNNTVTVSAECRGAAGVEIADKGNAENNSVIIENGANILTSAIGAVVKNGNATGNRVIMNGGNVGRIYGGRVETGNAINNSVIINDGRINNNIYGAIVDEGNAVNNYVEINGGEINNSYIYGSKVETGNAEGNAIVINNGDITGRIYAAKVENGDAINNVLIINDGTINADNGVTNGTFVHEGNARNNAVVINGGEIHSSLDGGIVMTFGNSTGNSVVINDGKIFSYSITGGYANNGNAENNNVTINGGVITNTQSIKGGVVLQGDTTGNSVVINDGKIVNEQDERTEIYGTSVTKGNAEGNAVIINGGEISYTEIVGANIITGDALNNYVEINSGKIEYSPVYGAKVENGNAEGNMVVINDGSTGDGVRGALITGKGNAEENTVIINGGSISGAVYGAAIESYLEGKVSGNGVILNGGSVENGSIYGAMTGNGTAECNYVVINTVQPNLYLNVYGGYTEKGDALNNSVVINGGKITGTVYGGYTNNGKAEGNVITISGDADLSGATIIAGFENANSNKLLLSDNTSGENIISINGWSGSVEGISGTDVIEINGSKLTDNGIINITSGKQDDLSGTIIKVNSIAGGQNVAAGDTLKIITSENNANLGIDVGDLITMLVVGIATLCVLGPIGYVISNILASAINGLSAIAPWLAPTIIGALLPFLVMTGTHHALTPIGINNRMTIGFDTIIYPGQLASNIAQGAAALAVSFKTKNMELKELTSSTGITAVCGITEPVLYGVTMKIRTNMIAAMVGGGVGGFFMGLMNTKNYSGGSPGLLTLPSYIGLDAPMSNFYFACAGAAIAFVVGFVVSFILYKDPVEGQENA